MNIKKFIFTILLTLSFVVTAFANTYTEEYTITNNDELFEVSGSLPIVDTKNSSLNKNLNDKITNVYQTKLENAKKSNVTNLDFSYEVIIYKQYVSIILYTKTTNLGTTTYTDTFVFNKDNYEVISLDDFSDIIPNIQSNNNNIDNSIPIETKTSFIDENQSSFYIENENIILIEPIAKGENINYSKFSLNDSKTYKVMEDDYYIKGTYKIVMIPLRETLEGLGYSVVYKSFEQPVEVTKDKNIYHVSLNENMYSNKDISTALEVSPEVVNDTTYVPISFFSEILDIYYNINMDGSITFGK